jgi:hypothetical protein
MYDEFGRPVGIEDDSHQYADDTDQFDGEDGEDNDFYLDEGDDYAFFDDEPDVDECGYDPYGGCYSDDC